MEKEKFDSLRVNNKNKSKIIKEEKQMKLIPNRGST
jgi:hypothetical protein